MERCRSNHKRRKQHTTLQQNNGSSKVKHDTIHNRKNTLYVRKQNKTYHFKSNLRHCIYRKVREDEGGTYGVSVDGNLDAIPYNRFTLETYFDTDESKRSKLVEIINQEFLAIASQGPRTQDLQKVKEFLTKQYQENLIENWYWQNVEIEKIITNLDIHTDYLTILEKIDEHAIQQFANVIVQTSNKKEIVQIGTK